MNDDRFPASFVDTNIFIYALDRSDPTRGEIARALLLQLMQEGAIRTSAQVLQELYVTATRKIKTPIPPAKALRYLDQIASFPVYSPDYGAVREAIELSIHSKISMWDSLVVVAAARSGAARLFTEELNDGQTIMGVEIVNPFRPAAAMGGTRKLPPKR